MAQSDKVPCYVAGPLGFSEAGRHYYTEVLLPRVGRHIEVIDPWALTSTDEVVAAERAGRATEMAMKIGRRNEAAIRRSRLLISILDGQEVDSGTAAEVGFAFGLGIRCYGLRTDFRQSGESGVLVNLQLQYFIEASGGEVVASLDGLDDLLASALHELD